MYIWLFYILKHATERTYISQSLGIADSGNGWVHQATIYTLISNKTHKNNIYLNPSMYGMLSSMQLVKLNDIMRCGHIIAPNRHELNKVSTDQLIRSVASG